MDLLTVLVMAIGLGMDCLAVSVAQGLDTSIRDTKNHSKILRMACMFGLFQGGMPLIGYFAGTFFADFFSRYAPWIALILLAFIGGKMIVESYREEKEGKAHASNWSLKHLLVLSVATSIDALATGVVFIPYPELIWYGIVIIGLVSFTMSILGCFLGSESQRYKQMNAGLIGGVILIGIGLKIWIEGYLCL